MGSTRLPGKMLLPLAGRPLLQHVYEATVEAFGVRNVVIAYPCFPPDVGRQNEPIAILAAKLQAERFPYSGAENDVLGRFYHCAIRYRWHPDSVIVRVTPDDPWKDPAAMIAVANGLRLPVEIGAEAFTLGMLQEAVVRWDPAEAWVREREHLTYALFASPPPDPPTRADSAPWTIDTREDYERVKRVIDAPEWPDQGP